MVPSKPFTVQSPDERRGTTHRKLTCAAERVNRLIRTGHTDIDVSFIFQTPQTGSYRFCRHVLVNGITTTAQLENLMRARIEYFMSEGR